MRDRSIKPSSRKSETEYHKASKEHLVLVDVLQNIDFMKKFKSDGKHTKSGGKLFILHDGSLLTIEAAKREND